MDDSDGLAARGRVHADALVVDDMPTLRSLVARMLERMGWTAAVATDGISALQLAAHLPSLRLVVTDLHMPGMRGDELAHRIRRHDPTVRLVLMSSAFDAIDAPGTGVVLLEKPFSPGDLAEAIRALGLEGPSPAR